MGRLDSIFSQTCKRALPVTPSQLRLIPDPLAVDAGRTNCVALRNLVSRRLGLGAPTPPSAERTKWFTQWEVTASPPLSPDPFASFASRLGTLAAVAPPAPI